MLRVITYFAESLESFKLTTIRDIHESQFMVGKSYKNFIMISLVVFMSVLKMLHTYNAINSQSHVAKNCR